MRETERLSFETLEYAKGTLSGLLNFSLRSGLFCCDGMPQLDPEYTDREKNPHFRCRCGYEAALETAIRCIEFVVSRKKEEAMEGLLHNAERRTSAGIEPCTYGTPDTGDSNRTR
ncbi:hypothetical protein [Pseudoflavonifractor phocaeensis]|uniref:hypothetical protein n=1 Tax=Pseudoflavonifractor phocaeensis TaxID=1870988 RepID=UPI00195EE4C4|nr:hypothetical protein [Pseudoflavonifractor phocaeensis]MBM6871180.1 hypothetical protein [Pseudoflavonifractor phocaeensis]